MGLGSEIKQSSKSSKDEEKNSESGDEGDEEAVIDEEVLRELQEMQKETPVVRPVLVLRDQVAIILSCSSRIGLYF